MRQAVVDIQCGNQHQRFYPSHHPRAAETAKQGQPALPASDQRRRSMMDNVMIDAEYDGPVFNIALADVSLRKNDLVERKYGVETKKAAAIAVKITDMPGEEVLVLSLSKGLF